MRVFTVAWICLAISAGGISGLVLCIGADGHVALEVAHQRSCPGTAGPVGPAPLVLVETLAMAGTDGGSSCIDVSPYPDLMTRTASRARTSPRALEIEAQGRSAGGGLLPGTPQFTSSAALRPPPALLSRLTVVLRI